MKLYFTVAAKKARTWRYRIRHFPSSCNVLILSLRFRLPSTQTQNFPVVLKNAFPLSFGSPTYIKMEERTYRLIWLSVESYQSKALELSTNCQPVSSRLAVLMVVWKAELLCRFTQQQFAGSGQTPPGWDLYTSYKSSEIDKRIPAKPDSDECDVQLAEQHPAWHVPSILDQGL